MKNKFKLIVISLIVILFLWFFLSFRLMEVPPGITVDEAAFGYNAVLISRTLRDENGRFLPFFVLSIDGQDWRQPVTQYLDVVTFKIFGPSFFAIRAISVAIVIVSTFLLFWLIYKLSNLKEAIFGAIFFLTAPLIMIHAHMALDNITPVPFVITWLLGLLLFNKSHKNKYLVLAGVALGICFYTYKAMRLTVPLWAILSLFYILELDLNKIFFSVKSKFKSLLVFSVSLAPFFAIMPILQLKYPGAILSDKTASFGSYQNFLNGYLANLDLSFLFISGDITPYHSTGLHGALLLASLPFFLIGSYLAIKHKSFYLFTLICFSITPLLFGLVGSVHRASRLIALVPFYSIICALGVVWLMEQSRKFKGKVGLYFKTLTVGLMILVVVNYVDFVWYYWFTYPIAQNQAFKAISHNSFLELRDQSKKLGLKPMIEKDAYVAEAIPGKFFIESYLPEIQIWDGKSQLPKDVIVLSNQNKFPGTKRLDLNLPYSLLVPE